MAGINETSGSYEYKIAAGPNQQARTVKITPYQDGRIVYTPNDNGRSITVISSEDLHNLDTDTLRQAISGQPATDTLVKSNLQENPVKRTFPQQIKHAWNIFLWGEGYDKKKPY